MTANRTGSLLFIDDGTAGRSSRINSDVNMAILFAQIQLNAAKLVEKQTVQMMQKVIYKC